MYILKIKILSSLKTSIFFSLIFSLIHNSILEYINALRILTYFQICFCDFDVLHLDNQIPHINKIKAEITVKKSKRQQLCYLSLSFKVITIQFQAIICPLLDTQRFALTLTDSVLKGDFWKLQIDVIRSGYRRGWLLPHLRYGNKLHLSSPEQ